MSKTTTTTPKPSDPEVVLPRRRTFTGEYRASILGECDAVTEPGAIGAILRREGLYSSHLVDWRRRRAEGGLDGLAAKKTGRPAGNPAERAAEKELERLRRENAVLEERLRRLQVIVEAQKKLAEVLAFLSPQPNGSNA